MFGINTRLGSLSPSHHRPVWSVYLANSALVERPTRAYSRTLFAICARAELDPAYRAPYSQNLDFPTSILNSRLQVLWPRVRASLSSRRPANFECQRSLTLHTAPLHGVSHQITGPKTAPCRLSTTIARLWNVVCESRRRARRNLDGCQRYSGEKIAAAAGFLEPEVCRGG